MKFILLNGAFMLIGISVYGQQVLSSSGGTSASANYSLTYSLGEPVTLNGSSENYRIETGFIGKNQSIVIAGFIESENSLTVSPNPFEDKIKIKLNPNSSFTINITDLRGEKILTKSVGNTDAVNLHPELKPGCYLVEVINESSFEKSVTKIIKL